MEIKVVASSHIGHGASKEEFDKLGGLSAGVCYLPDTIEKLFSEPEEKTYRRANMTKESGHHSPYDHAFMTLEIVGIPKIIAMMLNNEKMYTTSEKSARYKRMPLPEEEQNYYDKWLGIFKTLITERCQKLCPNRFTEKKIEKLAQENARYLTSVFTPTQMIYTISYRQYNILYSLFQKELQRLGDKIIEKKATKFERRLAGEIKKFVEDFANVTLPSASPEQKAINANYLDTALASNPKNRSLSLLATRPVLKQFGDSYSLAYKGSFAELAQAQRHRTITYSMLLPEENAPKFYLPPILKDNPELVKMWLDDCNALKDNFPQCMLVTINERGALEDFILKIQERNCTEAQLEIDNQTTATKKEMYAYLKEEYPEAARELAPYMKGSRCLSGYKCKTPCGFKEGIDGTRII